MQSLIFAAGLLAILIGLIHSVMGEKLIFSRMRNEGFIPTVCKPQLKERHVRILWTSWHLVTVFGWTIGAILFCLASPSYVSSYQEVIGNIILISMLFSSLLVLVGTKGMHPGWLGLLAVAILIWIN